MRAMMIVLLPLAVLVAWAIVYDVKRRRRHDPMTGHNADAAGRRSRGETDARGGGFPPGPGQSVP
jgi:hypothetical protein